MSTKQKQWVGWLSVLAAVIGLAILWRFTPLAQILSPRQIFFWMRDFARGSDIAFVVFALVIGVANVFLVPINLLLVAVAMVFPGWKGFFCGLLGAWTAAILEHTLGRSLAASKAEATFGEKFRVVAREMREHGLPAMIVLGLVPVAPNTLVNLAAGICRVPLWKLLIATTIGFMPGLIMLNLLGREMRQFIKDPSLGASLAGLGIVALLVVVHQFTKRIRARIEERHVLKPSMPDTPAPIDVDRGQLLTRS